MLLLVLCQSLLCQSANDPHYYDFWEGSWYQVIDGKVDTTATRFVVKKGINEYTFNEHWRMTFGPDESLQATGIRSWDELNKIWMYIWISAENHFQIWEGRKVEGHWYIYKSFNINGDRYLSRQAWVPTRPGELIRISEKSYDGGKTWQLRFKEYYRKSESIKN